MHRVPTRRRYTNKIVQKTFIKRQKWKPTSCNRTKQRSLSRNRSWYITVACMARVTAVLKTSASIQLKNFIITENSTKFNQQSMGLSYSPAYSYLLSLLLTFFFLEPLFSIQSNILEINFSSCKSPSVHFSSCTDRKIVKLVTSTRHISCFSFLFLLSSSYFSSRYTCTARFCLCQWPYNVWFKFVNYVRVGDF